MEQTFKEIMENVPSYVRDSYNSLPKEEQDIIEVVSHYLHLSRSLFLKGSSPDEQENAQRFLMERAVEFLESVNSYQLNNLAGAFPGVLEASQMLPIRMRAGVRRGYDFLVVASLSRY